ncbi:chemotaxis protein CheB [Paractinoplanes brasiliensis]|uniref:protein-glutamate methylesterase n=1 Tax=Paractinoplanes brasiliensis TaxID=52695 RepID=A0A4R6JSR8_9ACTN|nr:chemotaxis protein CheB [Actinoplanes brasiliensis]TDO39654.1 two-component system chemotaxis response regulator CheB [Actinoplanes brasiliensis]
MAVREGKAPVVAMVCSTGGLDAVTRILGSLPRDFPASVIVLRHHDPQARNRLASILQRHTVLPVSAACDEDHLVAGRVFVAPTGYHTLVTSDDRLTLIVSGDRPPYRPSADLLLVSLAVSVGPRAIAVVLSGYGIDGATGATAVHRLGGVVIASDKASSAVFTMPYATITRDEIINYVMPVDDIAALLIRLVADAPALGLEAQDREGHGEG